MESTKNINFQDIDNYWKHYFEKYHMKRISSDEYDTPILSLEDYENMKYLIKTLINASTENSKIYSRSSYSALNKANKLGIILWKNRKQFQHDIEIVKTIANLRSLTLNNLGCYFKSSENYEKALGYLNKAISIEKKSGVEDYEIATTLVNVSAVLSKLGNHEKALEYSLESVFILEKLNSIKETPEALSTAYFNYAVELEYLDNVQEAKINYEKAYGISKEKFGENHNSTKNFFDTLVQFNIAHAETLGLDNFHKGKHKKNALSANLKQNQHEPLDIIYQTYIVSSNIRFKIIIINKSNKNCIKILAFPENKYPVYRLLLRHEKVMEILKSPKRKFTSLEKDELKQKMTTLSENILIENGTLKVIQSPIKNRPFSAGTKMLVTTEKSGTKFSATLKDNKLPRENTNKKHHFLL